MYKIIKLLFSALDGKQRKQFYELQILVILMAVFEVVGIASIVPLMTLVGDPGLLHGDSIYSHLYKISGLNSSSKFIFLSGVFVLISLSVGTFISTVTTWRLSLYATRVGTEMGCALYRYYMHQPWLFHAANNSSQLTNKISTEVIRVTQQILQPVMLLNARIMLSIFIVVGIFVYSPFVATVGMTIFGGCYYVFYMVIRKILRDNSQKITNLSAKRFTLMSEGFGGIKDIALLGRQSNMIQRFDSSGDEFAWAYGANNALTQLPRYFMELLAFGSIIGLILYLVTNQAGRLDAVLPMLSVYALAGFKLLPSLQQIYSIVATIKGGQSSFEIIEEDLFAAKRTLLPADRSVDRTVAPKSLIELAGVEFTYPGKSSPALRRVNIKIPANKTIGIVGPSGSGKSTAIDIILGLIHPDVGQIIIDGVSISESNLRSWQNAIGFVPQSIFLTDGSIAENIAFSLPPTEICYKKVERAIALAHLDEVIKSLPNGINTKVGERGVQLSGGQRQRIGIARALYNDASVLIFDEATSALDGLTEKMIMDAISEFSGQKTIIMIAHRLKTVIKCDLIYYIKDGQVADSGKFAELVLRNEDFRRMAEYA